LIPLGIGTYVYAIAAISPSAHGGFCAPTRLSSASLRSFDCMFSRDLMAAL